MSSYVTTQMLSLAAECDQQRIKAQEEYMPGTFYHPKPNELLTNARRWASRKGYPLEIAEDYGHWYANTSDGLEWRSCPPHQEAIQEYLDTSDEVFIQKAMTTVGPLSLGALR